METKTRYSLLILAAIAALMAGMERVTMGYSYVASTPDPELYDDDYETPDDYTSTHTEDAYALGNADSDGTCVADVASYAWAVDGDAAVAEAEATAGWGRSWTWDGPPGTAPGATLGWSYWGDGYASAGGDSSLGNGGSTISVTSASGSAGGNGSGGGADGWGDASGYVYDDDLASASASRGGSPEPDGNEPVEQEGYGWYNAFINWANYDGDSTSIASGTSNIYFSGGAYCSTYSGAGTGPSGSGAEADAGASANASASLSADLY